MESNKFAKNLSTFQLFMNSSVNLSHKNLIIHSLDPQHQVID